MGNVVAEGIWNQLGRPELDRLALLLRESVQNSWDARDGDSIDYAVESFTLDSAQREAFREFFHDRPPPSAYRSQSTVGETIVDLENWLGSVAPRLLMVSDRGTRGLEGPTRADKPARDGEERHFVDFLRNVGQPPTKDHGGGTFGYGKAAFYLASETRTIVVHTRCSHRGELHERLTAAALTHHYEHDGLRYTGRHWWGLVDGVSAEPLTGAGATQWAKRLGLPGFEGNQRGTTVGVTAPVFTDEVLNELPWLCLRNLWPKLETQQKGRPPISVRLKVSGHTLSVPLPSRTPPYDGFWNALCDIRSGKGQPITYLKETSGFVALRHAVMLNRGPSEEANRPEHEVRPRHVALLRTPELVVKYMDGGRSLGNDLIGFTGVFLADPSADHAFALSEPPTHDDWQPLSVHDKRCRGVVTQALTKIRAQVREFATPHAAPNEAGSGKSLAGLSNEFAELLPGLATRSDTTSHSTGSQDTTQRGRQRRARPQAKILPTNQVVEHDSRPCVVFRVDLTHAKGSESTRLHADVFAVVSGGGREAEAPNGSSTPRAGWWLTPRGARIDGQSVVAGSRQQGTWSLFVPIEDSTAVAVEISASAEEPS